MMTLRKLHDRHGFGVTLRQLQAWVARHRVGLEAKGIISYLGRRQPVFVHNEQALVTAFCARDRKTGPKKKSEKPVDITS